MSDCDAAHYVLCAVVVTLAAGIGYLAARPVADQPRVEIKSVYGYETCQGHKLENGATLWCEAGCAKEWF